MFQREAELIEQTNDTVRDLWYRIAEAKGHKIVVYPKGKHYRASVYFEDSVVAESDHMPDLRRAHLMVMSYLPLYLYDLNVALSLYDDLPIHIYVDSRIRPGLHTMYAVVIKQRQPERDTTDYDEVIASCISDVSLADAYCRAWLAWQESLQKS